ncbi:hypothetical protein JOB18_009619 [Solea senegalensis]|uniref:Uncharacterized protein n=1 Tax=Solea senegalensis TaxID=28829 RepID=A0AAV6PM21_SOLSE|nr:hypothetical protein JOB18_009619 [Solea senegalensis]
MEEKRRRSLVQRVCVRREPRPLSLFSTDRLKEGERGEAAAGGDTEREKQQCEDDKKKKR